MAVSFSENEMSKFLQALRYASLQHRNQRRKGQQKYPYINHPIEVTSLVWEVGGVRDIDILAAALLHDTVEDTGAKPEDISQRFGERVRDMVMELTDDKSLPKPERKRLQVEHAPHMSAGAAPIKLADKISNVREISEDPPPDWDLARRGEYLTWAEQVVNGLRGQNRALEAHFDETLARARQKLQEEQKS